MKSSAYIAIAIILATVFAFMGAGSDMDINMLRGCADGEVAKWDATNYIWDCDPDLTGGVGSTVVVDDDDVQVTAAAATLDFGTNLDATESPAGEANIVVSDPFTIAAIINAGTIEVKPSGDLDDYITFATINNIPTIYGTGSYLRIGDAGTTNYALASEDDFMVTGILEVKGYLYVDGAFMEFSGGKVWLAADGVKIADNLELMLGDGYDTRLRYSRVDANAKMLQWGMPHTDEDANNVPVIVFGDLDIAGVDLGLFDGVDQPTIAVIEKDARYQSSATGTCDGADLDELTETGAFTNAVVGDLLRITAGTNVTAGWYWIDDVTDANNVNLDRDYCSGASSNTTYTVYHDFTMVSADGLSTRITDGAPSDSSVQVDRDGWLILDVGQANGRLYWRANNAWHYVDATAGVSLPADERTDPYGHTFQVGDTVEFVVDRINADGSFHTYPVWSGKKRNLLVTTTQEQVKVGEETTSRDVEVTRPVVTGTHQVAIWNADAQAYDTVTEDVYQTEQVPVYEAVWNDKTQSYDTVQQTRMGSEIQVVQELQQVARTHIVRQPQPVYNALGAKYEVEWVDVEVAQTVQVPEKVAVWNENAQSYDTVTQMVNQVIYDEVLVDVEVEVQVEVPIFKDKVVYETVIVSQDVTVPIFETRTLYETNWVPSLGP